MTINKGLKVFGIALGSCIGLILVVYLAFLVVNWNDQPPSATVARLEKILNQPMPADEDNAYVFVMGSSVPPDQDPRAWGKTRIASIKQAAALPWTSSMPDLPGPVFDFKSRRDPEVRTLSDVCRAIDRACMLALESGESTIAAWLASEQWLLDRYYVLLKHPTWRESINFDERLPFPPYDVAMEGQKLLLAQAWQHAGKGDAAAVKTLLEADLRYWRQHLDSSEILISKMVSVAAIKRHFAWAVLVLRRLPSEHARAAMPQQWLSPISDAERSLLRSFAGEWRYLDNKLKNSKGHALRSFDAEQGALMEKLGLGAMLQPQDTSNNYAETLTLMATMLDAPYLQYRSARARAEIIKDRVVESGAYPERMYNIIGDVLFRAGISNITSYADRTNDIEGLRRIAVLAVSLRSRGIAPEQIQQQLETAEERHPYDGTSFIWDAAAGQIVFMGLEKRDGGRHAVWY